MFYFKFDNHDTFSYHCHRPLKPPNLDLDAPNLGFYTDESQLERLWPAWGQAGPDADAPTQSLASLLPSATALDDAILPSAAEFFQFEGQHQLFASGYDTTKAKPVTPIAGLPSADASRQHTFTHEDGSKYAPVESLPLVNAKCSWCRIWTICLGLNSNELKSSQIGQWSKYSDQWTWKINANN